MPNSTFITGLDIGSTAIRTVVGQLTHQGNEENFQIIAATEVPSLGISKGAITSIEDATASISSCLEKTEKMIGTTLTSAWVGISGVHIISEESQGVIAVAKPNGEISEEDVERAIEAARTVATPVNYEILHVIPKNFTVDGQPNIKDPVGMTGIRLEANTQIIQGLSSQIKNLTKCVYRTGLDIDGLVLSILANSEAVVTKRQKELGVMVVNLGGHTTSFAVFEEGDLLYTNILPLGGVHITSDLAIGLRTSVDVAEKVKIEYGYALARDFSKKEEINLSSLGGENDYVSRKYIAEIIEARVEEIFEKLDKELKKIGRSGMLPAGVVLTGGGAKLGGIVEMAKQKLRLPACLGYPINILSAIEKSNDLTFTTALGLALWGKEMDKLSSQSSFFAKRGFGFRKITGNIKKMIQSLFS